MSCQFKTIANIVSLDNVKRFVTYSVQQTSDSSGEGSSTADPWNWDAVENDTKPKVEGLDGNKWVNDCHIAISPTGELLVIAYQRSMVILVSKWDSNEESTAKTKYHVSWSGEPWQDRNEHITSILCLPLAASQSRSSAQCGPDWTAIAVGFSSGALRFYTENGSMLFTEVFHEEPVTGIKCQSYQAANQSSGSEQSEELHVIYRNVVCCVFGFSLCNTLRACRNQLARVQANGGESNLASTAAPLTLRKFSLPEQGTVSDVCVGPVHCPTGFAHLSTASICGGFNAWYRPTPPQSTLVLATGSKPFVGFHYAIEGSSAPVLTDVAKAMATKLKSAIGQAVPGWLMGGKKPAQLEKPKDVVEPPEPMTCRFGLCDLWRQGERIVMSPNRKLSVVSDTLGRVILVDNSTGVALRMWKGYRDADCGWIMCHEERKGSGKRSALFLVIYVPKKGIIEVWALQQGPRIATFPASKTGRLLYVGHNLLGVTGGRSSCKLQLRSGSPSCIFLDHTGAMKEITVPFHCALSDKNSKRARDVLLLKKLKLSLREEDGLPEVPSICKELQTFEMRIQALDTLSSSRYVTSDLLLDVINIYTSSAASSPSHGEEGDNLDPLYKSLLEKCNQLEHLLTFYNFLSRLRQKPPDYDTVVSSSSAADDAKKLCKLLQISSEEIERVLSVAKRKSASSDIRTVKFCDNSSTLSNFLLAFQKSSDSGEILLNRATSSEKLLPISEIICSGYLDGNCSVNEWQNAAFESSIVPFDLMALAITFWLNKQSTGGSLPLELVRFSQLVKAICSISAGGVQWWDQVRVLLRDAENPVSALTAALVCKSVAASIEDNRCAVDNNNAFNNNVSDKEKEILDKKKNGDEESNNDGDGSSADIKSSDKMNSSTISDTMDWENISQDICHWTQMIAQLEDVALLSSILSRNVVHKCNEAETVAILDYKKPVISLGLILSKGKGSIPEMVAKWISCSGLNPLLLLEERRLESSNCNSAISGQGKPTVSSIGGVADGIAEQIDSSVEAQPMIDSHNRVIQDLCLLREHFPYSLASGSLLANLSWEYILAWNRDLDSITILLSVINCIKVINDSHLRQGICTMVWSTHLRARFEAALRLINKVGKVAKERLCRQDVGISDLHMSNFFSFCSDFIDIYMESNVMSEINAKTQQSSEALWDSCSPIASLTQLALSQPAANYDLLHLISQATRAMLLISTFSLRVHRPLAVFFDSVGQSALFSDIWSKPQLPSHSHDVRLIESRSKFLLRAVSAAMGTIVSYQSEWDAKQAVFWMSHCLSLAADWSVPLDPLRRQQACELYAKGFDRLAEEVVPTITDAPLLGSQLLVIVGQRLNRTLLNSNKDLKRKITNLSPAVTSWINELGDSSVDNCSVSETAHLAVMTLNLLPEDHAERHIARQLVDSLQQIVDSMNSAAPSSNRSNFENVVTESNSYVQ